MTELTVTSARSRPAIWLRTTLDDPLYRSAFSLMTNTAMTSVLGVVFWVVAARLYSSSAVGRDSALISAMMAISVFCQLNLNNALARFLPVARSVPARMVALTYALTASISLLAAVGFVVFAPRWSPQFDFLRNDRALAVGFCVSLPLWAVFTLQDSALTALRRAPWVVVENTVFGALKIAGLFFLFSLGVHNGVFVAWALPVVFITIAVNALLFRHVIPQHARVRRAEPPRSDTTRPALIRFLTFDYFAWVLNNGIERVMPLVVVALLGTRVNAYFYIAFTISTAVDMLLFNIGTSLTVEGAMAEDRLADLTRRLVKKLLGVFLLGAALLVVGAPLVLLPFGAGYAAGAAGVLRLLAIASLFRAVVVLYTTVARVRQRGGAILAANVSLAVLLVAATVTFGSWFGLTGVGLGWLLAHIVVALCVLPSMRRLLRAPRGASTPSHHEGGVHVPAPAALDVELRTLSRSVCAGLNGACPADERATYERVAYAALVEGYDVTRGVLGTLRSRRDDGDGAGGPVSPDSDDFVRRATDAALERLSGRPVEGRFAPVVAEARRRGVALAIADRRDIHARS